MNFHLTTQKSENFTSMDYFCPKYVRVELKKYRGVVCHDTEQWCKIWINPDFAVSKMAWVIGWTFTRALKVWKIVHWWAFFSKAYVSGRKFQRNYVSWHWRLMQNLKENWLLANFHASSWKSGNLHFDGLLLSKAYKYLNEKVKKSYVSWYWRVMQSLKKSLGS